MTEFDTLYSEYASTKNGNVYIFCKKYSSEATRFLLIRSFDTDNLKKLLKDNQINFESGKEKDLMKIAYNSEITEENLLSYIEKERETLIKKREEEVTGLDSVLNRIPIVGCGVRNDNLDTIVQSFTRNKELKSYEDLITFLNDHILSRVKKYCLWSYYNQTANDIIELIFLKHKNVIPTLRKIYNIDFFLRIENDIIPFDLKITHISDDYFELESKGITANYNDHDDYVVNKTTESELEKIKDYYKRFKKEHKDRQLPNISYFKTDTKESLASYIENLDCDSAKFINEMQKNHAKYVPSDAEALKKLEWWNYKYQGERLFCNNNRLFVFLAYKTKFKDGRELKGRITEITKKINELLDSLSSSSVHTIKYHYDKDTKLTGNYDVLSLSTIYSE